MQRRVCFGTMFSTWKVDVPNYGMRVHNNTRHVCFQPLIYLHGAGWNTSLIGQNYAVWGWYSFTLGVGAEGASHSHPHQLLSRDNDSRRAAVQPSR